MIVQVFADWLMFPILAVCAVLLIFFIKKRSLVYPYIVMAGLSSLLFAKVLSVVFQPETLRPFEQLGQTAGAAYIDNPGFPSDHVLLLTVAVLAVVVFIKQKLLAVLLIASVGVVGIARVIALVHTPLDIIGGVVCGLVGGFWYLKLRNEHMYFDSYT